jgi:hypothetical protein
MEQSLHPMRAIHYKLAPLRLDCHLLLEPDRANKGLPPVGDYFPARFSVTLSCWSASEYLSSQ